MREWRSLRFSEAVQLNPTVRLERGGTYPFVDMAALNPELRSVRASKHRKYSGGGSRFSPGDTLMARITPCLENGKISRFDPIAPGEEGPAHGSTEFIVMRGRPGTSIKDYVYYLTKWDEVRNYAIGQMSGTSGRQRVPTGCFDYLVVSIPPMVEQRAIAQVLGTLDDKIELNRRMNETLEALARALFKDWFVDFGPVRAKMEGRDLRIPRHIADVFPESLVNSVFGEVPVNWREYTLADLAQRHTQSIAPSKCHDSLFEHFSIPAYDVGKTPTLEPGAAIKSSKTVVPHGSVLLSKLNPDIPRVWIPNPSSGTMQICSTEFLAFTPTAPANSSLLFSLFSDEVFRTMLRSMVTGTSKSHQRVPPEALKSLQVLYGTPALFRMFGEIATPWLRRAGANRDNSQLLAAMRDALLPKLISGKIRIRDAEKLIESVA